VQEVVALSKLRTYAGSPCRPAEAAAAGVRDRRTGASQILIRRAQPFEISRVRSFVEEHFSISWADEISVGFAGKPVSVYVAVCEKAIIGFAAYECTRRAFFGRPGSPKPRAAAALAKRC